MPYTKKPSTRKPRRAPMRRRRMYPRRNPLPLAPTGSFATRSETYSIALPAGIVQDLNNISLFNLPVCQQMAAFFQYYRFTNVQIRIKPQLDTFVAGGAAGTGVIPYLYFLYDKSGSLAALNATQFEEAGAKPVRVDDKIILRKWRPAVSTVTDLGITQFKTSPWLPTHKTTPGTPLNVVDHQGAVWYISKINPADATVYDIDITVTVQFRKPLVVPGSSVTEA